MMTGNLFINESSSASGLYFPAFTRGQGYIFGEDRITVVVNVSLGRDTLYE